MTRADLLKAVTDPAYAAKLAGIRYQPDDGPGWTRVRNGRAFAYRDAKGKAITRPQDIARADVLAIPPAWKDVWIAPSGRGHLQATGIDAKGRKQYRYHEKWSAFRDSMKYVRLAAFAQALPALRTRIAKALDEEGLPRDKVAAAALDLIDELGIRVGNDAYAQENGTFGVTTLRERHLSIEGERIALHFIGKSHKEHELELKDRKIANILREEQELPGTRLFQFVDEQGMRHPLTSADVNAFIKSATGGEFTAKDFRTWIGTVYAYELLCDACKDKETAMDEKAYVKSLRDTLKGVAEKLGNTLAVTKSHYVHQDLQQRFCAGELPALRARTRRMKRIPGLPAAEAEVAALLQLFAKERNGP